MKKSPYRALWLSVQLILVAVLLQLVVVPAHADPVVYEPTTLPVEPVPVQMAYQPPLSADDLSDFIPPEAVITHVDVDNWTVWPPAEPPATSTSTAEPPPTSTAEPPATSTVEPPITHTAQPPVPPASTEVPPTTTTPDSTTTPANPTTTPVEPTATSTEPAATPVTPITTTLSLNGTLTNVVSFDDGALAVVIEENTFDESADLQFTAIPVPSPALSATNTLSNPAGTQFLMRFQLEALQDGVPVDQFDKPVRIVVDMRDLAANLNPIYEGNFFLAYQDEEDPTLWHDVPVIQHQADGLVSAEVNHFSNWVGGTRPTYWTPTFTPPTVSAFSGAATFSYPIQVPPGRHGLQPSVALSYSSRALDGRIHDADSGAVADGWSLAEISISRSDVKLEGINGGNNAPVLIHPDKFSLVLNGAGYDLFPASGANTTTDTEVRYYAKDGPSLFIKRYYNASLSTDGIYWIVITGDGTLYRLGYTADSQEWQNSPYRQISGHQGDVNSNSAITWNVDTVTDAFGNQMTYTYFTRSLTENVEWVDSQGSDHYYVQTTNISRIDTIRYNYPDRVTTLPPTHTTAQLNSTPASRIVFRAPLDTIWAHNTDAIKHIYIYHNSATPIKEYRLAIQGDTVTSNSCINYDTVPSTSRANHTRVVTSIREYANTDANPLTNDGWGLPATTFTYTSLPHFLKNGSPCSSFRYLSQVQNGYGGTTTFSYTSDGRSVGSYDYIGYGIYSWPAIGYNYFVTTVTNNDGRNNETTTEYLYTAPCYGQWDSGYLGSMTGASLCGNNSPQLGNIVGFATTTQTNKGYSDEILNRTITTFSQEPYSTIGRPLQIDMGRVDAPNTFFVLNRTVNQYGSSVFGPNLNFVYTSQTTSTQYQNGTSSNSMSNKVVYDYDPAFQGNEQYGNLTHIYEYDDANDATPYRTTVRRYFPNTSGNYWLVSQLAAENLHPGNDTNTWISGTWYYYDGNNTHAAGPTKGALTRSRSFIPVDCAVVPGVLGSNCYYARQTIDATFAYDSYGNQTSSTSYAGYGYRTFTASWVEDMNVVATQPRTTTLTYDADYKLYPVRATDPELNATDFEVYGFKNYAGVLVGLSGFQKQTGLLKQVTEPNTVVTKYEYDPFGRLHAAYDGYSFSGFGDSDPWNGNPAQRYRYWDNTWNNPATFLNPLSAPFYVTTDQRPGTYPPPANSSSGYAFHSQVFYDGFGRAIQQRSVWNWIEGHNLSREIISSTTYHALGGVACQTAPYDVPFYADRGKTWPASAFVTDSCTSKPRTTTTYDPLGRADIITGPDGSTVNTDYTIETTITAAGYNKLLNTSVIDANSHRTSQFTNVLGQLVLVREYSGSGPSYTNYADTRYFYDNTGSLIKVGTSHASNSDPAPNAYLRASTMTYDNFGRKITMVDADMGPWSYQYDAAGNLIAQVDANQQKLCFTYDSMNRLTYKRYATTVNSNCPTSGNVLARYFYTFDNYGLGLPSEIRWTSSSTQNRETFTYDSQARLTSHTRYVDSRSYTMTYGNFDAFHRPTTMTYPNSEQVTLTYDHEGANVLTADGTQLVEAVGYNDAGQLKRLALGNGLTTWYGYHGYQGSSNHDNYDAREVTWNWGANDSFGRLWRTCTAPDASSECLATSKDNLQVGDQVLDLRYSYDLGGNVLNIRDKTNSNQVQTFVYDHRDRLTSASTDAVGTGQYSDTYAYNQLGNITNYDGSPYTYDANHKSAVAGISAGDLNFQYDANGNMTDRTEFNTTFLQQFDMQNRMVTVTNTVTSAVTRFTYDDKGIRVKTVEPDGTIIDYPFPGYEVESPGTDETIRLTYSMAGRAIAIRQSGIVAKDNFNDGNANGWTAHTGTWSVTSSTYQQSSTTSGVNTNSTLPVFQSGSMTFEWSATFQSTNTKAGLYFFTNDAANSDHDDAYLIWQRAGDVGIWEVINNTYYLRATFTSATAAMGQTHLYKATYDPTTGVISVWRNGSSLGNWTDTTNRLTSGSYIALRTTDSVVRFDNVKVSSVDNLYYLHSDHLGSTSLMTDKEKAVVPGSPTYYYPFGDFRGTPPSQTITDRGFTGHHSNNLPGNDLGLIYMNARYYLPGIGRFASADTVVPDPDDIQAWNRYSYVSNNPLKYVDPSGHCWGPLSFARDTALYSTTCSNLDQAIDIIQHPDATLGERAIAAGYVGVEAVAHGTVAVGTAIIAGQAAVAAAPAVASAASSAASSAVTWASTAYMNATALLSTGAAGTAGAAIVADGDPTNEARAVIQAVSADGDPTNEVANVSTTVANAGQRALHFWNRVVNFNGNKVYQRNDLIDPARVDADGVTSLTRMLNGRPPVGPDGGPVILHHGLQTQSGPIFEIAQTTHRTFQRMIHINPNTIPTGINRAAFDSWREAYWKMRGSTIFFE